MHKLSLEEWEETEVVGKRTGSLKAGVGVRLAVYFLALFEFFNHMYVLFYLMQKIFNE